MWEILLLVDTGHKAHKFQCKCKVILGLKVQVKYKRTFKKALSWSEYSLCVTGWPDLTGGVSGSSVWVCCALTRKISLYDWAPGNRWWIIRAFGAQLLLLNIFLNTSFNCSLIFFSFLYRHIPLCAWRHYIRDSGLPNLLSFLSAHQITGFASPIMNN
jgi:hypothetical protein